VWGRSWATASPGGAQVVAGVFGSGCGEVRLQGRGRHHCKVDAVGGAAGDMATPQGRGFPALFLLRSFLAGNERAASPQGGCRGRGH
jgi:hypothetical protein